ncbi:hypothetical protein BC830DRAFT_175647 [Chytriomyces sp. MP71]|nr:hypothetical protein BC830DRAFT_175647 [Chytriomyces sp. MP71]
MLLDLSSSVEDHIEYGNAPDTTMKPGSFRTALPIIRRLNRHSSVVLKSFNEASLPAPAALLEQETRLDDLMEPELAHPRALNIQQNAQYFSGGSAAELDSVAGVGGPKLDAWTPNLPGWTSVAHARSTRP